MKDFAQGLLAVAALALVTTGCSMGPVRTKPAQPAQAQAGNAGFLIGDAFKATSPVFNWGERQPYIDLFNQQYTELTIQNYGPKTAASPLQVQATEPVKGKWYAHGFFDRHASMGPTMIEFDLSTPGVLKLVAAGENASQGNQLSCPVVYRLTAASSDGTFVYSLPKFDAKHSRCFAAQQRFFTAMVVRPINGDLLYVDQRIVEIPVPQTLFVAKRYKFW